MTLRMIYATMATLTAVLMLTACGQDKTAKTQAIAENAVKIRTAKLQEQNFDSQIHVHGNIRPVDSAVISAKSSGTLELLKVKEGDAVKKGDLLFQVDYENLKNMADMAGRVVEHAKVTLDASELDLQMAETTWNKAELDYARDQSLIAIEAISEATFEKTETTWKNAKFTLEKAKTGVNSGKLKVEESELALKIAKKALADSSVYAPYDAIVTARKKYSGEFVGAGTPVLMIESQQQQEISAYISAIYYNVITEKTPIIIKFAGKEICRTTVSYLAPNIDPLTRTFEIKAKLPRQGNVISGSLCDLTLILAERKGVGIRADAVLARAAGKNVVLVADGDVAREIEVTTGFTTNGVTEILTPEKLTGKSVIVSGQYYLNDGGKIINMDGK